QRGWVTGARKEDRAPQITEGPANIRRTRRRHVLLEESIHHTENTAPPELASIEIDSRQMSPWRFLARQAVHIPEPGGGRAASARPGRERRRVRRFYPAEQHTHIHRIHVLGLSLRIERCATPVRSAVGSRKQDCGLETDGGKQRSKHGPFDQLAAILAGLRRHIGEIFGLEALPDERRRLHRKRLRWPGGLTWNLACR